MELAGKLRARRSWERATVVRFISSACFRGFLSFEMMWRKFPGFLTFVLDRFGSKQKSLRTASSSSACDVEVAFSGM